MSKITELLGVDEGEMFDFRGERYYAHRFARRAGSGALINQRELVDMIESSEGVIPVRLHLTPEQAEALKAIRTLCGDGWLVSYDGAHLTFSDDKPRKHNGSWISMGCKMFDLRFKSRHASALCRLCMHEPIEIREAINEYAAKRVAP